MIYSLFVYTFLFVLVVKILVIFCLLTWFFIRRCKNLKPVRVSSGHRRIDILPKKIESKSDGKFFDVVVLGGGIHGAAVARQLVISGKSVLLCDKGDWACGTSQGSAKLGHAGVRYLGNAIKGDWSQFPMVSEGMQGRRIVKVLAPHIARKLGFLLLNQKGGMEWLKHRIALLLYDIFGWINLPLFTKGLPWSYFVSKKKLRDLCPFMSEKFDCSAIRYFEYSLDDTRFVMANVLDAVRHGCVAKNYTECIGIEEVEDEEGVLDGYVVKLRDRRKNEVFEIECDGIVNATGAYVFDVANLVSKDEKNVEEVAKYKGCFIVVEKQIRSDTICYQIKRNGKQKIIYMIPYGNEKDKTMIGTTDSFVSALPLRIEKYWKVEKEEDVKRIVSSNTEHSFVISIKKKMREEEEEREFDFEIFSYSVKTGEVGSVILLSPKDEEGDYFAKDFLSKESSGYQKLRAFGEVRVDKTSEVIETMFSSQPSSGSYSYVIPFDGSSVILDMDVLLENDSNSAVPSFNDINYLIEASNEFFSEGEKISTKDVISAFCGLRSYKKKRIKKDSTKISRKHEIDMDGKMINIYGGKLTTSYLLASEIRKIMGNQGKKETEYLKPLVGGYISDPEEHAKKYYERDVKEFGGWLSKKMHLHLVGFYGSEYQKVLDIVKENEKFGEKICEDSNHIIAEVVYGVRFGFVTCAEDFLRRRTNMALEFGDRKKEIDRVVDEVVKAELLKLEGSKEGN